MGTRRAIPRHVRVGAGRRLLTEFRRPLLRECLLVEDLIPFAAASRIRTGRPAFEVDDDARGLIYDPPAAGTDGEGKITSTAARIKLGLTDKLYLGNLDAQRDWGHAAEYVNAMHLMLQQDEPDDYVVATGETHSVREFCELAFGELGLDYNDHVEVDPRFFRPADVELLVGNASKARKKLGWEPRMGLSGLVREMIASDMEKLASTLNVTTTTPR